MKRKFLSILLTLAMALTLLPVSAMAEGEEGTAAPTGETVTEAAETTLPEAVDGVITLGNGNYVMSDNMTAIVKVPTGVTAMLDLGGKTLTNKAGEHTITVEKGGKLNISDSVGTGVVDNSSHGKAAIYNEGEVTLNGGTFERSAEVGTASPNDANGNSWYTVKNFGTMEINNGVTIKNKGSFSSTIANGWQNAATAGKGSEPAHSADAVLTINGGNISGGKITVKNDDCGKLTINKGTFTQSESNLYCVYNANVAEITGGTINGNVGNIKSDPNSEYNKGKFTITGGAFTDLANAVKYAADGATIKLADDVTVTKPIEVTKSMTLDLNGHVLTAATASDRSESKDEKNSAIWVTAENVNLTINGMTAGSGMKMGDTHNTDWKTKVWGFVDLREGSAGSTVTVNGGSYTGSTCAGDNYHYTALFTVGSESKLILNNVSAETDERVVKASSCGEVVVSGGTYNITGINAFLGAAFETKTASFTNMKLTAKYGGCVQVGNNATFENCEIKVTDIRTGEGTYLNCAVAVLDGGTATIKSGIYTAPYAAYVYSSGGTINIENGTFTGVVRADATTDATATINIKNGSFKGDIQKSGGPGSETITITGGLFSSKPAKECIANGYYVNASNNGEYPYIVNDKDPGNATLVVVKDVAPDTAIAEDIKQADKEAIDLVKGKTSVQGVGTAVSGNKDTLVENSKVDTNGATEVKVEVKVNVNVTKADLTAGTMTFEAKPVATVTTTKEDGTQVDQKTNVEVPNSLLNGEITVKLPLPANFEPKQIKHISSDGSVEYFLKTAKRGAKTFEIIDGCAVFTITKFSTFELSGVVTYVEPSSGGGSSSSSRRYDVSAPSVKNGDVTVSPKNASKGDTVTITVKPDSGYELDTLTVKDASGSKIKVKNKGDGKFTFTMPASKVTVSAEFAEIETLDFADVSTDAYYYEAVKWAAKKGITGGTGDGTFNPNGSCTRAHIVTFLWRAAGSPEPKSTVSFADVPADSYYAKAVAWAVENGITLGTGDGTFSPNATCTRAQSVTFLYRALGTAPTTVNGFTDVTADAFYADAVAWAVESGVTNGTTDSTFSPNNGCTRAQIVTFLYRTMK